MEFSSPPPLALHNQLRDLANNLHKATKRFLSTCFPSSEVSLKTHTPAAALFVRLSPYVSLFI